jgi:CRP-like cAMP-binding protein
VIDIKNEKGLVERYVIQLEQALMGYLIPKEEIRNFTDAACAVTIKKGDYFISIGEIAPWIGFIVEGAFRCFYYNADGGEYTKHFFQENDFMAPCGAALTDSQYVDKESEYAYQALTDAIILQVHRNEFGGRLKLSCWREMFTKEIYHVHRLEEKRIRQLMLEDAENRYKNFIQDFPGLADRIRQIHIASYIGVSPVSLSRIRAKLKEN